MLILLSMPSFADDIFVRNKPYKGTVRGSGVGIEVRVDELAKALGVEAVDKGGVWEIDGLSVPSRVEEGQAFVSLNDLEEAGFRVSRSAALGTIDIHKALPKSDKPKNKAAAADWGAPTGPALVYFGAKW